LLFFVQHAWDECHWAQSGMGVVVSVDRWG